MITNVVFITIQRHYLTFTEDRSPGLKSRFCRAAFLSGGSREESVFLPFPTSRDYTHSLVHGCFPLPSKTALPSQVSHIALLQHWLSHLSLPIWRTLVITLGHSDNLKCSPWDFPGGPVVKNLPPNARDSGWISGQGTKIPHAEGQLSLRATTTELTHLNQRALTPQTTEPTHSGTLAPQLEKRKAAHHN